MKKTTLKRYIRNKYVISGAVILIVILFFVFQSGGSNTKIEFASVKFGDITEKVSVTGKISPVGKADLGFEKGGVIRNINVKVGDRIKKWTLIASLDSAGDAANLASAQAKLDDITRGLNTEELAVEQSKVNSASISLINAKQEALNVARTGYVQAQSAITNYTDSFFDNPQSVNPTIKIRTGSQNEQSAIGMSRLSVTNALNKWKSDLDLATSTDGITLLIAKANGYVNLIRDFISALSTIVNNLNPGNSGLTQATIDAYVVSMNSGLTLANQAISSVNSAKSSLENALSTYEQANSNFILRKTGSSAQAIAAQTAMVAAYRAEYEKDRIISPIDGVVTRVDPNVGEFVSVGKTAFTVINEDNYKIDAYIAESDIAKVSLGDFASTTLDAYGQSIDFPAIITNIDPAETVLEGVPTYKVTLQFLKKDNRIRSGMTANLEILTNERKNVISIPTRAVIDDSGEKTVRKLKSDSKNYISIPVKVGLKGSDGMIEIISGLKVGDKVVTYIK